MSKVKLVVAALGMSVVAVEVAAINPIVFKMSVNKNSFGSIVNDGDKVFVVDVVNNTADELTPTTVMDLAVAGYKADKPTAAQVAAINASESTGTVLEVTAEKNGKGTMLSANSNGDLVSFCKTNGYKIDSIEILTQNDVIFSTVGLKTLPDLVKDNDVYYTIDIASNTAKVVDAQGLSDQAAEDFKAGKNTTATRFVSAFGLISKLTLKKA